MKTIEGKIREKGYKNKTKIKIRNIRSETIR
jgi:hypothetical protein